MTKKLLKYGVAFHVALMVIYSSWARGGSSPYYLWALPYLALGVLEMMLLLPPASRDETPETAVGRLFRGLVRDPITYLGLALLAFLTIQWANGPCELVESAEAFSGWDYTKPPAPSLPFCVDRFEALQPLLWFIAVIVAVLAIRNSVKPSGRYFLLKLIVVNGALLSVLGFAQLLTCPGKLYWYRVIPVYFFSTFGYPNHGGTFFVMTTALSIGLLIRAIGDAEHRRESGWLTLVFIANAAGIYGSLSRAAIIMGSLIIVVFFIYALFYLSTRVSRPRLMATASIAFFIACCVAIFAFTPGSPLKRELDTVDWENFSSSVYEGDRKDLAEGAIDIWRDHPWTGVGGWGFRRYVGLYFPEEKWQELLAHGRANVHNDALQFLCEHGMIGFGLIVAITLVLLLHGMYGVIRTSRELDIRTMRTRSWIGSVSPCAWGVIAAVAAMAVHSTIDLPFRSVANMLIWFICLACLPGLNNRARKAAHVHSEPVQAAPSQDGAAQAEKA